MLGAISNKQKHFKFIVTMDGNNTITYTRLLKSLFNWVLDKKKTVFIVD
jgi:hypothetical protein